MQVHTVLRQKLGLKPAPHSCVKSFAIICCCWEVTSGGVGLMHLKSVLKHVVLPDFGAGMRRCEDAGGEGCRLPGNPTCGRLQGISMLVFFVHFFYLFRLLLNVWPVFLLTE